MPETRLDTMLDDLFVHKTNKFKMQPTDLYMMALRQMLKNQVALMVAAGKTHGGDIVHCTHDSSLLIGRIEQFINDQH